MLYNRCGSRRTQYAITVGGGAMANPGRYLTLLPPINGADAVSGSPYFPRNPGDPYKAWDAFDHFRLDAQTVHHFPLGVRLSPRQRAVLTGRGGITPGRQLELPARFQTRTPDRWWQAQHLSRDRSCPRRPATPVCQEAAVSGPDLRKDEPSIRMRDHGQVLGWGRPGVVGRKKNDA